MGRTVIAAILGILALAGPGRAAGDRYALLVGVKQYDRAELTPLDYTENDVEGLAEVLRRGGYKRVVLMTQRNAASEPNLRPTSTNIRRELSALLGACKADDTVVLAFCGHGLQFAGSDEPYFCPMDASVKDKRTLISLGETYEAMGASRARVKVLFSDACRNDPLSKKDRLAMAKQVFAPKETKARDKAPENVVALFSCSPGEVAYESAALKHGIFFHYLIKGLSGDAASGTKAVTLNALTDYVQAEVPAHVRDVVRASAKQRPERAGRTNFPIVLVEISDLEVKTRTFLMALKFREAEQTATLALKAKPDSAVLLAMRAHAREQMKQGKEALADADRALELDPNLTSAYVTRGSVHLLILNKPRLALLEFDTALKKSPRHPTALLNRGLAYLKIGDLSKAEADLIAATQLAPKSPVAYLYRSQVALRRKNVDEALNYLNRALAINPRWGQAYYERALVRNMQDDPEEAMRDLDEAVKHNPRLADAWNERGNLHLAAQELEKAVADYTQAIKIRPGFAGALYNRAQVFFRNKDYRTAVADLDESIKAYPRYPGAWLLRGATHARLKNHKQAVADFTEAIARDPKSQVAYRERAHSYEELGDQAKADADKAKAKALGKK